MDIQPSRIAGKYHIFGLGPELDTGILILALISILIPICIFIPAHHDSIIIQCIAPHRIISDPTPSEYISSWLVPSNPVSFQPNACIIMSIPLPIFLSHPIQPNPMILFDLNPAQTNRAQPSPAQHSTAQHNTAQPHILPQTSSV